MAVTAAQREQLKAFATGDLDRAQELSRGQSDEDWIGYRTLLGALFAVLLDHHFQGDAPPQAIAGFVDQMRREYAAADAPIKAWTVEGVLRATTGDEHFFEELSSDDILATQILVVGRLALRDPEVSDDIDRYLDRAEQLVNEWEQRGA